MTFLCRPSGGFTLLVTAVDFSREGNFTYSITHFSEDLRIEDEARRNLDFSRARDVMD